MAIKESTYLLQKEFPVSMDRNPVAYMQEMHISCSRRCTCRVAGDAHLMKQEMYMSCNECRGFQQTGYPYPPKRI